MYECVGILQAGEIILAMTKVFGCTYNGDVIEFSTGGIPSGIIVSWYGTISGIPTGWYLCDGTNGTPDLRNRFVMGAQSDSYVSTTGGSNSRTLTTSNLPSHTHAATLDLSELTTSSAGAHTHGTGTYVQRASSSMYGVAATGAMVCSWSSIPSAGAHTHTISGSGTVTIANTGSGASFDNRPAYYALLYIMKG